MEREPFFQTETDVLHESGEITHYVADYFTFPHNKIYPGGFKEHCAYEEHLKHELRAFFKDGGTEGVE